MLQRRILPAYINTLPIKTVDAPHLHGIDKNLLTDLYLVDLRLLLGLFLLAHC
jgi:hypothetical protein